MKVVKDARGIPELVDDFVVSVIKYSEFILKDSEIANRYFDSCNAALSRTAAHGDEGLTALAKLLDDDRVVIRTTAACYLVHFKTEKALEVLRATAKLENRGIAMLAIATLKRWEKGIYMDPATGKEKTSGEGPGSDRG